jgi:hypothetical protein
MILSMICNCKGEGDQNAIFFNRRAARRELTERYFLDGGQELAILDGYENS